MVVRILGARQAPVMEACADEKLVFEEEDSCLAATERKVSEL